MGVMRQCGDPVCPPCECQHHGAAYSEMHGTIVWAAVIPDYTTIANNTAILSRAITITERCCIAVNAAAVVVLATSVTDMELERPQGTIRTTQEDIITTHQLKLSHHAAWEVLNAGVYTYHLMNRSGASMYPFAAWLKVIALDCEG